jgi:hypothetical protein
MYSGDVMATGPLQEANGKRWLSNLPIADYPLLLCDRSIFETDYGAKDDNGHLITVYLDSVLRLQEPCLRID